MSNDVVQCFIPLNLLKMTVCLSKMFERNKLEGKLPTNWFSNINIRENFVGKSERYFNQQKQLGGKKYENIFVFFRQLILI